MCSIFCIFGQNGDSVAVRKQAISLSALMRHRGPDWTGVYTSEKVVMVHERLSIVDIENGAQPLFNAQKTNVLCVNGEIYNHRALHKEVEKSYAFQTNSDCEIILALYEKMGSAFLDSLLGMFAFALYDTVHDKYLIARDHLGIIPLYLGYDKEGKLYVASEMKALVPVCDRIEIFPPGHFLDSTVGKIMPYYSRSWMNFDTLEPKSADLPALQAALEESVKSHLMTDVPYGVLLSGGLDSSIISAVAARFVDSRIEDEGASKAWWPRLHSFAVGLKGAKDLAAARIVADHLRTVHHEIHFTVQEGIDVLGEVIKHIESFDVTSVRASVPMYLMARKIKAMGIKMVLSGEGSDEIFGGYLYFHKAPNEKEFHEETVRKLAKLHQYDCLRANKAMAAWGVEARVPFLDKKFMDTAMSIAPKDRMCGNGKIEKHILRESFAEFLPKEIVWRQKEQFSDGVGYSWIDSLKAKAETEITDQMMQKAQLIFPLNPPLSKEAYLYRQIFEEHFGNKSSVILCVPYEKSVACSSQKAMEWDASFQQLNDPSGRTVNVHDATNVPVTR
jgi:asparagine synthase (glutamine-hydrolysing)